jgi:hypothetical protein
VKGCDAEARTLVIGRIIAAAPAVAAPIKTSRRDSTGILLFNETGADGRAYARRQTDGISRSAGAEQKLPSKDEHAPNEDFGELPGFQNGFPRYTAEFPGLPEG